MSTKNKDTSSNMSTTGKQRVNPLHDTSSMESKKVIEDLLAKVGANIRQISREKPYYAKKRHWFIALHEPSITVESITLKEALETALKHMDKKHHKKYKKDLLKRDKKRIGW